MKSFNIGSRQFAVIAAVVVVAAVILLASYWRLQAPDYSQRAELSGMVSPAVQTAQFVCAADDDKVIEVTVGLKLKNVDELKKLLADLGDPASSQFRRYLRPDEFTSRFCPTQEEYDQVIAYLKSCSLIIVEMPSNRRLITLRGTIAQIKKAFDVHMNIYYRQGVQRLCNAENPTIPACLSGIVESIMGLNGFARFQSLFKNYYRPWTVSDDDKPSGFSPAQIATAYDFPNSNNKKLGTVYSGKHVTIAIASAENYDMADVQAFWRQFGIDRSGATIEKICVGNENKKLNVETTLDLQQISSQASCANILMYLASDSEDSSFARVFNRIVCDNRADIISYSWGLSEDQSDPASMKNFQTIYMQASAQGIPVFCASGDDGAYDSRDKKKKELLVVDYPSSDPYVVAVGGTHLSLDDAGKRTGEQAWTGSGGGISSVWDRPAWQRTAALPAGDKRVTADVALFADPWLGYAMYFQGKWQALAGGTSFAAPNWAAFWALTEEACGGRVGSVCATVYRSCAVPADRERLFLDITKGDNGADRLPGYKAGPGWDYPTGWGVPNGRALVDWLKSDIEKKR